jgi:hypothetical protein
MIPYTDDTVKPPTVPKNKNLPEDPYLASPQRLILLSIYLGLCGWTDRARD